MCVCVCACVRACVCVIHIHQGEKIDIFGHLRTENKSRLWCLTARCWFESQFQQPFLPVNPYLSVLVSCLPTGNSIKIKQSLYIKLNKRFTPCTRSYISWFSLTTHSSRIYKWDAAYAVWQISTQTRTHSLNIKGVFRQLSWILPPGFVGALCLWRERAQSNPSGT